MEKPPVTLLVAPRGVLEAPLNLPPAIGVPLRCAINPIRDITVTTENMNFIIGLKDLWSEASPGLVYFYDGSKCLNVM